MDNVVCKVTVPPATYPVTLAEVKAHARISSTVDDTRISEILIPAATEYVEGVQKRQLITATAVLSMPRFPRGAGIIQIPLPPLISITSITYTDSTGTVQTVSAADYQVDTHSEPGEVAPARGKCWPSPDHETLRAVQVTFQCGYGAASVVPKNTKQGLLTLCAHWYKHPELDVTGAVLGAVKHSLDSMLSKERIEPPDYEEC